MRNIEDEMDDRAKEQDTQRVRRMALRKRMQPAVIVRPPSTDRGRQD